MPLNSSQHHKPGRTNCVTGCGGDNRHADLRLATTVRACRLRCWLSDLHEDSGSHEKLDLMIERLPSFLCMYLPCAEKNVLHPNPSAQESCNYSHLYGQWDHAGCKAHDLSGWLFARAGCLLIRCRRLCARWCRGRGHWRERVLP